MNDQSLNQAQSVSPPQMGAQSTVYPYPFQTRPPKDLSIAMVLEILPGLFGLYGFGWIYSGNSSVGILLLVGGLVWGVIAVVTLILTAGFACFCTIPINILAVTFSSMSLNNYMKEHPELFGV